jgi:hypothetical protein
MFEFYNENPKLHNQPVKIFKYQETAGIYIGPFPTHDFAYNYHKMNGGQLDNITNNLNRPGFNIVWSNGVAPRN